MCGKSLVVVFSLALLRCAAEPVVPTFPGCSPAFFLPERLFAAPDTECNIYFKDVFDSCVPQNYAFQALSPVGESQVERWHWTPTPSDAGRSVPVVISAWQEGVDPVAVVTTVVEVARAPFSPGRRMTVSVLADSLANSGFPQRIRERMLEGGFTNLVSVGSRKGRTPSEAAHDGYGGFTCRAFMTRYAMSNDEFLHIQDEAERQQLVALGIPVREVPERQRVLLKSPFVRLVDGKPTFDIGWWLDCVNGGAAPDVIVVMLGVNDFFSYTGRPNEVRVRMLADVFPSFSEFIGKLRDKMPRTRIALCTIPNGCGQDGFGANYGAGQNEVQHRKNVFVFNRELKRFVEESDDANLELLPVAHAVDPVNAFPHVSVPANACTDEKVKRDGNALHSTAVGGRQIGDSISAWLQCRWDEIVDRYGKPVR